MHARRHILSLLVLLGGFALLAGCGAPVVPTQLSPPTATPVAATTAPDTPTPTPTATPTPTPTPTPLPAVALEAADSAAFIGDWDAAAYGYGHLLARPEVTRDQAAAAVQGLAKVYMSQGLVDEAIELLTPAVADDASAQPGTADPVVEILLGDALRASGAAVSATVHYSAALAIEPQLALHIHEWIGDALVAVGEHVSATDVYSAALPLTEVASERVWLLEKMALAASASGDYDGAIAHYDAILSVARIPSYRARIMYQAAETALVYGDQSAAFERMQTLVETHPTSDQAYDALVTLVEAGDPVDDLTRGLVDYHAEAYGPAVQAFSRVVLGDPDHDGAPHHYAGLSFREAGSPQLALDEFDLLITTHPDDPLVPDAMLGKALTLVDLGSLQEAGDLLVEMADSYPDHERAPEARFQAGLYRYRAGAVVDAQSAWYDLTRWYPYDELAQGAWYWLGKTHLATGETLSATAALSEAVSLGPWDFYGLQAASAQANEDPFPLDVDVALSCDTAEARIEAEAWLAGWLAIDSETDVGALPQALLDDARLRRATLLLRAGRFSEAGMELEKLREATAEDPLAQYRLALAFRDLRLYRSSIVAATTLWRLSPAEDLSELPRFIGCLIYPTYYSGLVVPEADSQGLSPLFVYALLRQESLFEGYATSVAAARGLMQVIPPTGAAIAQALDWPPDYETSDLYRPMVSVRFGVWYLAEQRDAIEDNLFAGMAAYNGGPGNSAVWWDRAGGDPDLFVELIGFHETRRYVRLIREHFAAYRWLYAGE